MNDDAPQSFDGPDLEREAAQGRAAVRVLNDPAFKESVERVRRQYHREFEGLAYDDTEEMKILKVKLRVLGDIVEDLHGRADTGMLANTQMEERAEATRSRVRLNAENDF